MGKVMNLQYITCAPALEFGNSILGNREASNVSRAYRTFGAPVSLMLNPKANGSMSI